MNVRLSITDKKSYRWLALYFLVLQVAIFAAFLPSPAGRGDLMYYCYNAPLLFAFAFATGRTQMIKGLISVGLLAQAAWFLDLLGHLAHVSIFGLTEYMFEAPFTALDALVILVHALTATAALVATRAVRPRPLSLLVSAGYIAFLYAGSLLLTQSSQNINCAFSPCVFENAFNALFSSTEYVALWPVFVGILAVATYWIQVGFSEEFGSDVSTLNSSTTERH